MCYVYVCCFLLGMALVQRMIIKFNACLRFRLSIHTALWGFTIFENFDDNHFRVSVHTCKQKVKIKQKLCESKCMRIKTKIHTHNTIWTILAHTPSTTVRPLHTGKRSMSATNLHYDIQAVRRFWLVPALERMNFDWLEKTSQPRKSEPLKYASEPFIRSLEMATTTATFVCFLPGFGTQ